MNRRAVQLILVAALVAIAGCAGGMGGTPESNSPTDDSSTTDSSDGGMGTAAFYVSDDPSVINDFQHLNVTITSVKFKRTGDLSDGDANGTDGDAIENESVADDGESTNETSDDGTADEDTTDTNEENETDGDQADGVDETDEPGDEEAEETDDEEVNEETEEKDDGDDERWITYDIDNETVDLTELKGANASMIGEFELPAGEYETVRLSISETEGVLTDGSTTRVKLPSNKLKLQTTFIIGDGERVDFVYDIAPHKAGNSGKYILKPVISQSGTGDDVEIRDIDKEKDDGEQKNGNDDKQHGDGENRAKGK